VIAPNPVERRRHDTLHAEQIETDGGANDVDNRIGRAHFMEMDLFNRLSMDLCFGLTEPNEDSSSNVFLPLVEAASVDHCQDLVQMAMRLFR